MEGQKIWLDMFEVEWSVEAEELFVYREVSELNRTDALPLATAGAELVMVEGEPAGIYLTYVRGAKGDILDPADPEGPLDAVLAKLAALYEKGVDPLNLMPEEFTVAQLRKLHETILGEELQKDTFRRRVISSLVGTGYEHIDLGRPAELFRMFRVAS